MAVETPRGVSQPLWTHPWPHMAPGRVKSCPPWFSGVLGPPGAANPSPMGAALAGRDKPIIPCLAQLQHGLLLCVLLGEGIY